MKPLHKLNLKNDLTRKRMVKFRDYVIDGLKNANCEDKEQLIDFVHTCFQSVDSEDVSQHPSAILVAV